MRDVLQPTPGGGDDDGGGETPGQAATRRRGVGTTVQVNAGDNVRGAA